MSYFFTFTLVFTLVVLLLLEQNVIKVTVLLLLQMDEHTAADSRGRLPLWSGQETGQG